MTFQILLCLDMDLILERILEDILSSVLEEWSPEVECFTEHPKKALLAVFNRKDVFTILLTRHGKSIIF